ncbi:MAG: HU family DNA-binding protein [Mailhella sp.]|nr:HU family DNA-binding protein [Mailhella sp.]
MKDDSALLPSGFGKFGAYGKDARTGRNPQTDGSITLAPHKVAVFRQSRKFRKELKGGIASQSFTTGNFAGPEKAAPYAPRTSVFRA